MPAPIELKSARPLVSGTYRDVYQHPSDPALLIKVIKPGLAQRHGPRVNRYDARFGVGHYRSLLREIEKYLLLRRRGQENLPFIQHFAGLLETDLGLGMIVGKVRGPDGALAPTLMRVVSDRGLDGGLRARIEALREELIDRHIVFGDISGHNIVEDAEGRLVIVDGLNDRLWLPVNTMSRFFYAAYCRRRFARMMAALETADRDRRG